MNRAFSQSRRHRDGFFFCYFSAARSPQVAVYGTKVEQGSIFQSIVYGQRYSYDESVDSKELPEPLASGFQNLTDWRKKP